MIKQRAHLWRWKRALEAPCSFQYFELKQCDDFAGEGPWRVRFQRPDGRRETDMPCRQNVCGEFIERKGRKEVRKRERQMQREEEEEEREVGRVLPYKGTGYCPPCTQAWCTLSGPQGAGPFCLDANKQSLGRREGNFCFAFQRRVCFLGRLY